MRLILGQKCLICKQASKQLICPYCANDLPCFDLERYHYNLLLAPYIKKGLAKVTFPKVVSFCDYQWPISTLVSRLKFSAQLPNAKALADLFVTHCLEPQMAIPKATLPDMIIPMPLHKNRYLQRKFNQSIEIAKHVAKLSNIQLDSTSLKRVKSTQAQTNLNAKQRRHNLRHAFKITPVGLAKLAKAKHVALFDDVITTGTTMGAAYHTLNQIYPNLTIDVWSVCLTLEH